MRTVSWCRWLLVFILFAAPSLAGETGPCDEKAAFESLRPASPLNLRDHIFEVLEPWTSRADMPMREATRSVVMQWLYAGKPVARLIFGFTPVPHAGRTRTSKDYRELLEGGKAILWPGQTMRGFTPTPLTVGTYELNTGNRLIWYPISNQNAEVVRKTMAAQLLAEAMNVNVTPRPVIFARARRKIGVASLRTHGMPEQPDFPFQQLTARTRSNVSAFEFLVGSQLDEPSRVLIRPGHPPEVQIISHRRAFATRFPHDTEFSVYGGQLPETYTVEFRNGLDRFINHRNWKLVQSLLTTDEITALQFRRDLILTDMRLRTPLHYIKPAD